MSFPELPRNGSQWLANKRHVSQALCGSFHQQEARAEDFCDVAHFIPSRIEPTIPPTTPPCMVSLRASCGKYSLIAWASLVIGNVWSQIRPGPVSDARKIPSPPKIMFLMPGTVVI